MGQYSGHKFDNCVIEVLTQQHGSNIMNWWRKQGIESDYIGNQTKYSGIKLRYYGLYQGYFDSFDYSNVVDFGLKIITLPNPLLKYFIYGGGEDVRPLFNSVGVETTILQPEEYSEDGAFYYVDGNEVNIHRVHGGYPDKNYKILSIKKAWEIVDSEFKFNPIINEEEMEKEFNDMEEMSEGIMDSPIKKSKKHPLNNTVIKSLNNEHGANIIKWWKKQGIETNLDGSSRQAYGLYNDEFYHYHPNFIDEGKVKVITLPNPLMDYCIKGSYDEVTEIYESIGVDCKMIWASIVKHFIIRDNCMLKGEYSNKTIITPNQAKQMIEEFYAPEPKAEVKVDKPTYPYIAKVWNDDYDDVDIAIVVANIEVGKPKYPILSVCNTDINLFINGEKYDHTWYKNAEPISCDLESITNKLKEIDSTIVSNTDAIKSLKAATDKLYEDRKEVNKIKELLELMNKAK